MSKTDPIPVRFEPVEDDRLNKLHEKTGLSKSEIIRRAVAYLNQAVRARGGGMGWIVDELAPQTEPRPKRTKAPKAGSNLGPPPPRLRRKNGGPRLS